MDKESKRGHEYITNHCSLTVSREDHHQRIRYGIIPDLQSVGKSPHLCSRRSTETTHIRAEQNIVDIALIVRTLDMLQLIDAAKDGSGWVYAPPYVYLSPTIVSVCPCYLVTASFIHTKNHALPRA